MPWSGKCGEKKCPEFCLCTEVGYLFDLLSLSKLILLVSF